MARITSQLSTPTESSRRSLSKEQLIEKKKIAILKKLSIPDNKYYDGIHNKASTEFENHDLTKSLRKRENLIDYSDNERRPRKRSNSFNFIEKRSRSQSIEKKKQAILKSLEIPDNKDYDGILQQASNEFESHDLIKSLRKRNSINYSDSERRPRRSQSVDLINSKRFNSDDDRSRSSSLEKKQQALLKSLQIPDNKDYDGIHEQAFKEYENHDLTKSLRKRNSINYSDSERRPRRGDSADSIHSKLSDEISKEVTNPVHILKSTDISNPSEEISHPSDIDRSRSHSLEKKQQSILKSLQIPDNKDYDGIHQQAFEEFENHDLTKSLRKRSSVNYSDKNERKSRVELNTKPKISSPWVNLNPNVSIMKNPYNFLLKIKYPRSKFFQFRDPSPLRKNEEIDISDNIHDDFNVNDEIDGVNESSIGFLNDFNEINELPYRGALSKSDSQNNKSTPSKKDRILFKKLLKKSEPERLRNNTLIINDKENNHQISPASAVATAEFVSSSSSLSPPPPPPPTSAAASSSSTRMKFIQIRDYEIQTWYTAPYPEEYNKNRVLYICENCLKYMSSKYILYRHKLKCDLYHPPGNEIYREGKNSIFEIDGGKNIIYCQNLCLLAKLFLNSKTLYYDVEPFMFYVLTEVDPVTKTHHFVGYFSKEKLNSTNYNLSCILTLPIYQRKGYGNLLMDFSYLLSKREFKQGTPEKPLSDLGLLSYRNFWKVKISYILKQIYNESKGNNLRISIQQLSNLTGMITSDVIIGLEQIESLIRDPASKSYAIQINLPKIDEIIKNWELKNYVKLNPNALLWKPLILGPSCGVNQISFNPIVETTSLKINEEISPTAIDPLTLETINKVDPMKNSIEILSKFLQDDLKDPRDIEITTTDEIKENENFYDDVDEELNFENYEVCYPGMNINKIVIRPKKKPIIADDDEEEDQLIPVEKESKIINGDIDTSVILTESRRNGSRINRNLRVDTYTEDEDEDMQVDLEDDDEFQDFGHEEEDLDGEFERDEDQENAINLKRSNFKASQRIQSKNLSQIRNRRRLRHNYV